MATAKPLSAAEEQSWRALMRIVKVIPRYLDSDLVRGAGLTASEYTTIMHLSEGSQSRAADGRPGQCHRLVREPDDSPRGRSRVSRPRDEDGQLLRRTRQCREADSSRHGQLKAAWPVHLASVRRRFFDGMDAGTVEAVAKALGEVADHLEDPSAEPGTTR